MQPQRLKQINLLAVLIITAIYIAVIYYLKLFLSLKYLALLILLVSIMLTLKERQMKTLGYVAILSFGIFAVPIIATVNPTNITILTKLSELVAKMCGLIIFAIAGVYYLAYDRYLKDNIENQLEQVEVLNKITTPKSKEDEIDHPPVLVCREVNDPSKKIIISGKDRYLHTLLIGSTGTGKTSTVLGPMVWQDLMRFHKGYKLGITAIAPDQEFCLQVRDWCEGLGIPYTLIDLDDPGNSGHFNPLEGDPIIVSEIMRTVLRATFGEQDAFFAQAQELHAKNTMLLLKKLRGDNLTLIDVYQSLMDLEAVQFYVDQYIDRYGEDVLTIYFKKEAFGRLKEKLHQFAMGLRLQISDLLTNDTIQKVLVNKSDISLDKHMAEGGVLLINTALGKMGYMSRIFGQFLIMHIQNAVFRRPGTEFTRIPHYLYVDELPVYFNPELKNLLNLGRKYRCSCTFTIQGPSQLEVGKEGEAMREIIINGCRNKIVIGVESAKDAKILSEMFGEDEQKEIRRMRKKFHILPHSYTEIEKDMARFTYTNILELKPWHCLVKVVQNGRNLTPVEGRLEEPWLFQQRVNNYIKHINRHRIAN